MNKPEAKGWCPSALMPMMSGDGLLVRIKPAFSRLASRQAQTIAFLSKRHGNGFMDITNRANIQIRGLRQSDYPLVLKDLQDSGIAEIHEARDGLNLILAPFTERQSIGWRCAEALYNAANAFPTLPPKFGFAIDCGATRYLQHASSDIRVEIDETGQLLIRLDGCERGYVTSEETFQNDVLQVLHWFVSSQNKKHSYNRMHHLIADSDVPDNFITTTPCKNTRSLYPGREEDWHVIALPFGQITADQLLEITDQTKEIIFSINRCLVVDRTATLGQQFITSKNDLRYHITACAGMPACTSAGISTKQLALTICKSQAILAGKSYHISGCTKGCAKPSNSDICIIGERGSYNMLENGCAWDKPSYTSLSESALMDALFNLQKTRKNAL